MSAAMPKRVQQQRTRGWRMPPNTKSVARPHKWGNPYSVEEYGLDQALALFAKCMEQPARRAKARNDLRGYNLACFCRLDQPCHADLLLQIANSDDPA